MGLLEERETAARVRVEELRAEADRVLAALRDAEAVLERRVIAVVELAEALDTPGGREAAGGLPEPPVVEVAVAGSVVPHRRDGTSVDVLAPVYRRIVELVDAPGGAAGLRVKHLARGLGLELVPGKLEGVRSKAKRLVARGWLAEPEPGVFTPRPADGPRRGGPGAGS
ncbi:hypothetical protein [Yinghuangia sp. YIM S09857]|uniref:hypothetical protein n=1 Tax=Yinghuangia sp. YIM S09857 TaxID=3436929 RepID=UPI003F53489B